MTPSPKNGHVSQNFFHIFSKNVASFETIVKIRPHLYANTNEACGTEANPNECQKVFCLAFALLNRHAALRTYFFLKYQLQTNSVWLFTEHLPQKWMMFSAPRLQVHIFEYTYKWWRGNCENSPLPTIGSAFQCVKIDLPFCIDVCTCTYVLKWYSALFFAEKG